MKKFAFVLIMLIACTGVHAQSKGDHIVSTGFVIGTGNDWTNYGVNVKYQYSVLDRFRLEPNFAYFFKKDLNQFFDAVLNVQYVLPVVHSLKFYPIAGLGLVCQDFPGISVDSSTIPSSADVDFLYNFGCGIEYWFGANWGGFFEFKHKWVIRDRTVTAETGNLSIHKTNWNRSDFILGASYKF